MNIKLCLSTLLLASLFAMQGCGKDATNPGSEEEQSSEAGTSSEAKASSGTASSSVLKNSSTTNPSSGVKQSSVGQASSSSKGAGGTLLGYCSQKLDPDLKGSFCNEIWIEKKVSADTVDLILTTYASGLESICGIGATFTAKAACSQSNVLLACQYKAPQAHGAGAPATISRIFTIAEDAEAKLGYTAYHDALEASQGSPCLNAATIPQDVIYDNREATASGNGCQITNLLTYGRACMQSAGVGVAATLCDAYKQDGLTTEVVENCPTSGIILTCKEESVDLHFYEKAKAPKNCSDIQG